MPVIGSAPTKLLLFGEHSAVYGFPALGIPLAWKITAKLTPIAGKQWKISAPLQPLLEKLPAIFPETLTLPPHEIAFGSDAPIGVGFGSSGALCVALTRALFMKCGLAQDSEAVWTRAHALESYFHAHPSGVDTGISTMEIGGYLQCENTGLPGFKPLTSPLPCLVVGAFPRSQNTRELVSGLRTRLQENAGLKTHLAQLGAIAQESIDSLGDPDVFGALADRAHSHLQALGMSTPALDDLLDKARALGACGGKLSGAGGGGAFYLVCKSRPFAEALIEKLTHSGFDLKCHPALSLVV